jgi:hypothetical protein
MIRYKSLAKVSYIRRAVADEL